MHVTALTGLSVVMLDPGSRSVSLIKMSLITMQHKGLQPGWEQWHRNDGTETSTVTRATENGSKYLPSALLCLKLRGSGTVTHISQRSNPGLRNRGGPALGWGSTLSGLEFSFAAVRLSIPVFT